MRIIILTVLLLLSASVIDAQNKLEVDVKAKITDLDEAVGADSVVVWLPDGTLARRTQENLIISYFLTLPNGIQTLLDAGECPLNILNAGATKTDLYGKLYQGGLIYYLDDQDTIPGIKGLVAASTGTPIGVAWGNSGGFGVGCNDFATGAILTGIGDGATNTTTVLNAACDSTGSAFVYIDTLSLAGYADWVLPSRDELFLMWTNLADSDGGGTNSGPDDPGNLGGFAALNYWSSSEFSDGQAYNWQFSNGALGTLNKANTFRVRATRGF